MPAPPAKCRDVQLVLDLHLHFSPPMCDSEPGIVLTNTLTLPFAPTPGLIVTGTIVNDQPSPLGIALRELTWDADGGRFLARVEDTYVDYPLLYIGWEIRSWLNRGWRFGSFTDEYQKQRGRKPYRKPLACGKEPDLVDEEAEQLHRMKPQQRPPYFNALYAALVRELAVLDNNAHIAYAMQKTKMYFAEPSSPEPMSGDIAKFFAAAAAYENLTDDQQDTWRENIARRNPRLDQIIKPSRGRRRLKRTN